MVINPSLNAKTVSEFITYANANPGKVNMASGGIGNITHLSGELFKMMAGVNMVHVPYRGGGAALTDLLGGQVQVLFTGLLSAIEYTRSAAGSGGDERDAFERAARYPQLARIPAGLRNQRLEGHRRTQGHSG